uniref:Laminin EGF-like domain-containing protein n=1 Tax=Biomphalaria glabrata TaxID=6526 RepID=A0A2C9KYG9_BIOGL
MCLPGVTGERCDRCLPRWILVPNRGCQECDYCVHLLIDDLDTHYMNVNVVRRQLHEVSVGVGAFNRLSSYQDQVSDLRVSTLKYLALNQFRLWSKAIQIYYSLFNREVFFRHSFLSVSKMEYFIKIL